MRIYCRLGGAEVTAQVPTQCIWEQCGCCAPGLGGGSCRGSPWLTHSRAVLRLGVGDGGWVPCLGMLVVPSLEEGPASVSTLAESTAPSVLLLLPLVLLCLFSLSLNLPFSGSSQTMREAPTPAATVPGCIYFSAVSCMHHLAHKNIMSFHSLD